MSSEYGETAHQKTVSLPSFSGGKKKVTVWWKRFFAYATIKKFADALEEKFVLPADPEKITGLDKEIKEQTASLTRNDLAIACLTMAFLSEEDMEYIEDSATEEYPNGVAKSVIERLMKNYRPADRLSAVEAET